MLHLLVFFEKEVKLEKSSLKYTPSTLLQEKRFTDELQKIIDNGEQPSESELCRRVGVSVSYLRSNQADWVPKLKKSLEKSFRKWIQQGGKDYKQVKSVLSAFIKDGRRPQITLILNEAGRCNYYLKKGEYPWKIKLLNEIEKADLKWQENGGSSYKSLKKSLTKLVTKGHDRPLLKNVCEEAGFKHHYLIETSFPWQDKIKEEIEKAGLEWDEKQNEIKRLDAKVKAEKESHLVNLDVNSAQPKQLYEQFIVHNEDITSYKHIGIDLGYKKPMALSRLMYTVSKGTWVDAKVDPTSFKPERKSLMDAWIIIAYNNNTVNARQKIDVIFKAIEYCTTHAIPLPLTVQDARTFYKEYTTYLFRKHHIGKPTITERIYQDRVRELIEVLYPDKIKYEWIVKRVPTVPSGERESVNVDMDEGGYALSFYFNLFHKLADFFLDELSLPHVIQFNKRRLLIAPYMRAIVLHEDKKMNGIDPWCYYTLEDIRLYSLEEAICACPSKRKNAIKVRLEKLSEKIEAANQNMWHPSKIQLMELTIKTFLLLLSGLSGQTESTLLNAEWEGDDDFSVEKSGIKRLVTIKPRANYRKFGFPLHRVGIFALRKYLRVRQVFIKSEECKFLFPPQVNYRNATSILMKINPHLTSVGTMKLRDMYNKIVLHVSGGDLMLTAGIMGHSPKVNAEHYNDNPRSVVDYQLGHAFIPNMVKSMKDESDKSVQETPQSSCSNFENGVSYEDGTKLDCNNIFACFFCKHFRTHPIYEDIHKLMSLLYITIFYTSGRARGNKEQYKEVLEPVIDVINTILHIMIKDYGAEEIIEDVKELVFQKGVLTTYWQRQFELLKQIGAF